VRLRWLAVPFAVLALGAVALWSVPASDFIFTPHEAQPLADRVHVEDATPSTGGDVYYVDVLVRRTTWLEDLLPFTRPDGSTVVPEQALLPPGTSEAERDRENAAAMQRSERIASAVALRALGFEVVTSPLGTRVVGVLPGKPAEGRLEAGDLVTEVDGRRVRTPEQLRSAIGRHEPGESVRLTARRDGETIEVSVPTVADEAQPSRPVVGIIVSQEADIELPLDVDIDLGSVGGPSAGLPFALEIARMLGRDVTNGCEVAATGELALDGSVVSVGGLKQKTIGVRFAGVDVFVVPAGENARTARENAGGLRIIPVESYQQALRTLTTDLERC
jgi:PDZ domain-containing protein